MLCNRLPDFIQTHYEVHEWKHASAILSADFPDEWDDILDLLTEFRLRRSWITRGSGLPAFGIWHKGQPVSGG